ncbi:PREDICTED: uncharacterized protein LOC104778706 [Camelina sativa]|uniref:Uncharacterized protein LOC104778706 n=1 Tax=Camelina sativa TaxID=90675 RepID=A0ABM0YIL8_CAMSA|nr:PREDICTED: uncharacterized protein LOC104778706 [Camelina sativa]
MVGSIDCMHWVLKNFPTAWKGTFNDLNGLDRSPVLDDILYGEDPQVTYYVNGREYNLTYYLTNGIYPNWATFIQSIPLPHSPKASLFAERQEGARKDVEHAFGVLQARFAVIKNLCLLWDEDKVGLIMRACIILHNMIVENERDEYTQANVSDFPQGDDVDISYSIDMASNISNVLNGRIIIRDREVHDQLKHDLVEHL